jgi:REP element-mobilizing transposase RayT
MLTQEDYKTHNHVKLLVNYHFVWIPKRRKKVLIGEIATRARQLFALTGHRKRLGYFSSRSSLRPYPLIY